MSRKRYGERVELCWHSNRDRRGGVLRPEEIVLHTLKNGMDAFGIADDGGIFAWPALAKQCAGKQAEGLKLLYGMTLRVCQERGEYPVVIYAKNQQGIRDFYRLVTAAERNADARGPRISQEELFSEEMRENLLIGDAGRLLGMLRRGADEEALRGAARAFDFLLVKPHWYYRNSEMQGFSWLALKTEDLQGINRRIVALGQELQIPVAATCDPHYIDGEQEEVYSVLLWNELGAELQEDTERFFGTQELLECFSYLSEEEARRIVITHSREIAERCEKVEILQAQRLYPALENGDERLRAICEKELKKQYGARGEKAVWEVWARLDWELEAIQKSGTHFVFLQTRELLQKLKLNAYRIHSRGMLANSLVAYLCGISEIDPAACGLAPYFAYGWYGEKALDLDLNFPPQLLKQARKAAGELEGLCGALPASCIERLGEQRARVYLENFCKAKESDFLDEEEAPQGLIAHILAEKKEKAIREFQSRLADAGAVCKRHVCKVALIPEGVETTRYCPLAKSVEGDEVLYFDAYQMTDLFYSIDLFAHKMPEQLHALSEKTGVELKEIPLDDPQVMEMFQWKQGTDEYPECYGINDFETDFVMQVLRIAKPQSFEDLVRISGLCHGSGTWIGTNHRLLLDGVLTIRDVIASRDDVYDFLMRYDIDQKLSFELSEYVRRGKAKKKNAPLWEQTLPLLKKQGIPAWFLKYCEDVEYLFPRGHARSYMLLQWRLAWFKHYHPESYEQVTGQSAGRRRSR